MGSKASTKTSTRVAAIQEAVGGGVAAGAANAVTVGSSTTVVLAADANRQLAIVTNVSDQLVYLAVGGAAVSGKGVPLSALSGQSAGGSLVLTGPVAKLAINGICASGGKSVATQVGTVS